MCGILFSTVENLTDERFQSALNRMAFRGPDAAGMFTQQNLRLGHRRLAIIDLQNRSNCPMISADGQYALIYNGEIYNYLELAKQFNLQLQTTSDTEVLLALYIKLGRKMLPLLNGMFAFVIVNLKTKEWFVARDRLGVKPLYVTYYGDGFLCSSEPAPLLHIIGQTEFDPVGIRQYRKLRTFFNGHTLWRRIRQFPAGHFVINKMQPQAWWHFPEDEQPPPADEELSALIIDAVKIRQLADVSVGTYLSGGIDSSIVTTIAKPLHSWTVGFAEHNEFSWGRLVAKANHTQHHEIQMEYNEFLTIAKHMLKMRAEVLSVPNEVLIYAMTKEAATHNKVILSGEGADELFFGYDRIFNWAKNHSWNLREFSAHYAYGQHHDLEIVESVVAPFLDRKIPLAIVNAFFQVAHLHGLLRRLDSASMLCGVEARTPFVDYRLIERLFGVTYDWKHANGIVKAPLKRIFKNNLPSEILIRPKVGFPVPLQRIFFTGNWPMDEWFEFNLSTIAETAVSVEDIV